MFSFSVFFQILKSVAPDFLFWYNTVQCKRLRRSPRRGKEHMNAHFFAYLLCGALLVTPCAAAQAESAPAQVEEQAEESIMRTAREANLRSRPGKDAARLNTLLKGKKVKVLDTVTEDDELWAHVRVVSGGQEGYVLMSLLEEIPEPTPSPEPTATPEPTQAPSPVPEEPAEELFDEPLLVRTTMPTNLRKDADGKRIDTLQTGTYLDALGQVEDAEGSLWYHVQEENGREGYVLAELLYQIRPANVTEVAESEVRELFPLLSYDPIEDARESDLPAYSEKELAAYTTLDVGTRSQDVLELKQRLYEMGYFKKPNENQNYTESTAEVIEKFQEDVGLPVTGVADPLTQAALFDERTPKREGSAQEEKYLANRDAPLVIQKADVTNWNFHGSLQLSVRNNSGRKLTAFAIRAIPYMRDGSFADMAETFAEEIEREYEVTDISIADGNSYSDFVTNNKLDDGIWPHHFEISNQIYFSGAQIAVSWYRSGGKKVYVDDDQLVFVNVGSGAGDTFMNVLPVTLTAEETANSSWEMGVVTRYVLPVYQEHYGLPQGAWVKSVEEFSPAEEAGLQAGDIIVGVGEVTILGDATLRKARGQVLPGQSAALYFWRDGTYYVTDIVRPDAD